MQFLGLVLMLAAGCAMEHGGQIGWGALALALVGFFMVFPNLIKYLFEGQNNAGK